MYMNNTYEVVHCNWGAWHTTNLHCQKCGRN